MSAGRPKGSTAPKIMKDALILALNRAAEGDDQKQINRVAAMLVEKAAGGDVQAIKEVFDRVDGKAHQSIDLDATVSGQLKVTTIQLVALKVDDEPLALIDQSSDDSTS